MAGVRLRPVGANDEIERPRWCSSEGDGDAGVILRPDRVVKEVRRVGSAHAEQQPSDIVAPNLAEL